jgi:hypothetical protein
MESKLDYEGKILNVKKTTYETRDITCIDGIVLSFSEEEYKEAKEFAGFNPKKGSIVRGFRIFCNGIEKSYQIRFVR